MVNPRTSFAPFPTPAAADFFVQANTGGNLYDSLHAAFIKAAKIGPEELEVKIDEIAQDRGVDPAHVRAQLVLLMSALCE